MKSSRISGNGCFSQDLLNWRINFQTKCCCRMLNTTQSFILSISRFHLFFFHNSSHGRWKGRHVHCVSPGQCFWAARRKCLWRIGGANWREVQLGDTESVNGMVCHHLCSEDVCCTEWFWSDGDWPCVTFTTMESSHGLLHTSRDTFWTKRTPHCRFPCKTRNEVFSNLEGFWNFYLVIVISILFYSQLCNDTVDGRNPANQLRLVVYPFVYRVLYIPGPGGAGLLLWGPVVWDSNFRMAVSELLNLTASAGGVGGSQLLGEVWIENRQHPGEVSYFFKHPGEASHNFPQTYWMF